MSRLAELIAEIPEGKKYEIYYYQDQPADIIFPDDAPTQAERLEFTKQAEQERLELIKKLERSRRSKELLKKEIKEAQEREIKEKEEKRKNKYLKKRIPDGLV